MENVAWLPASLLPGHVHRGLAPGWYVELYPASEPDRWHATFLHGCEFLTTRRPFETQWLGVLMETTGVPSPPTDWTISPATSVADHPYSEVRDVHARDGCTLCHPQAAQRTPDHIYFLRAGQHGLIKIGVSVDVAVRIAALQTGSEQTLRLLGTLAGGPEVERAIHRRFAGSRVQGEWFWPSPDLLAFIDEEATPN